MKLNALNTWTQQIWCKSCHSTTPHTITVYSNSRSGLTERKCKLCGETTITLKESAVPS